MNHSSSFSQMRTDCSIPQLGVLTLGFPVICCSNMVCSLFSVHLHRQSQTTSRWVRVQTQMWLSEYVIYTDRKHCSWTFSLLLCNVLFPLMNMMSGGWIVPCQTSHVKAECDSDRPLSLCPTDWSFTHNNLHGNQSSCRGNCLLTVSPSAWCESGGCLGDNLRE